MISVLIISYISFVSLGIPDSLLGAAWPVIHTDLGVSVSYAGILSISSSICTVISSFSSVWINRKLGTGKTVAISTLLTSVALLVYAASHDFWLLIPASMALGLGGGAIDSAVNNYAAVRFRSFQLSFLHAAWGIGATISPMILAMIMHRGWRWGYLIIGLCQMSLALVQFCTCRIWGDRNGNADADVKEMEGTSRMWTKRLSMMCFFFYCAYETSSFMWISSYVVEYLHQDPVVGAKAASALFAGMTIGRILSGILVTKIDSKTMIYIGIISSILVSIMMLLTADPVFSLVMVFLLGLAFAPIYPNMTFRTPRRFSTRDSADIVGKQVAFAYLSSLTVPPLFGIAAGKFGFGPLPAMGIVFLVLLLVFTYVIEKKK